MSSDTWKDAMFVEHADMFARVLSAKQIDADFGPLLNPDHLKLSAALDLGCGTGRLLPHLGMLAATVVGLDYSPPLLHYAARHNLPHNCIVVHGDFRQLQSQFVAPQFDLIVRAYTSLGYFDHDTELQIATQCARIAKPGCRLLVDTFNALWFRQNQSVTRTTKIDTFSLVETYVWNPSKSCVEAHWRYLIENGQTIDMPFTLDGYDGARVANLLKTSGWTVERLLCGYDPSLELSERPDAERIIAVAIRQ